MNAVSGLEALDSRAVDTPDGALRLLRAGAAADRAVLVRFNRVDESWEVLASDGWPLIADKAVLPMSASTLVRDASEGRATEVAFDRGARPCDRVAAAGDLHAGAAFPLAVGDAIVGAVVVEWRERPPDGLFDGDLVADFEAPLLRAVLVPRHAGKPILVCHEDRLVADGIARMIEARLGVAVKVADSPSEAVAAAAGECPSLIVSSDRLAPGAELRDVVSELRGVGVAAPVLVLAALDTPHALDSALAIGALGYVPRSRAAACLVPAVVELLDGRTCLPSVEASGDGPRLSRREHEVLLGFEQGLSDKEIANSLGITASTVKTHARRLYAKLDASSRARAVHKARALGVI